jgi:CBS domain-containing protein
MTAGQFAQLELPYLETLDTCDKAMGFMDEFKLSHYPVVNGSLFHGLIYEEDIYETDDWSQTISASKIRTPDVSILTTEHFLSVVNKLQLSNLSCVAVVDSNKHFQGIITRNRVVDVFGEAAIVQETGSVIELEMSSSDYYLTEISRIVESTGVKILGTYIRSNTEVNKIILTIKLNKQEVEDVLAALERFGYNVLASYHLKYEDDSMHERYDNLMNLLNL